MSNYQFIRQGKGRVLKRGEDKDRKPYTLLVMKTGKWVGWTVKVQAKEKHLWARKVNADPWNPDQYNDVPGESWTLADPIERVTKAEKRYSFLVKRAVRLAEPTGSVLVQTLRENAKPKACTPFSRGGYGLSQANYYATLNSFLDTVRVGFEPLLRIEGTRKKAVLFLVKPTQASPVAIGSETQKVTITPYPPSSPKLKNNTDSF